MIKPRLVELIKLATIAIFLIAMFFWTGRINVYAADDATAEATDATALQSSIAAWKKLTDEQTWQLLPALASGDKQPLPNWVKPIALQMPRTAAAMLELDAAQRLGGPLDPSLKAKLRWVIAHENRSAYGEATSLADLKRVPGGSVDLKTFTLGPSAWSGREADALEFVRLLTVAAPTIPDALFERLRQEYGDGYVASMVLLAAYGNFQDRFLLGLQVPIEEGGPLPPLEIRFAEGALQRAPIRPGENGVNVYVEGGEAIAPADRSWTSISLDQLQARLEKQRDRKPRLPVPDWRDVKDKLPKEMNSHPTSIRWSLVTFGYAPELAIPWAITTRTHWAEFPSERILEESLFWVQTRAIECNYCMGHCEMLLEQAGLDKQAVSKRTRLLAETDWAKFPRAEQIAYDYARKLTLTPDRLTEDDYRRLEKEFGPKRAMSIYFWLCRGLYMTRISDGFQLPLERDNVFANSPPKDATKQ